MKLVTTVRTPSRSYPVYSCTDVGQALSGLWKSEWRQAAIIGDQNTALRFGPAVGRVLEDLCPKVKTFSFPPGEDHKTRATKGQLEDELLREGFDRTCCVVAVGGGIALDVGGYVAATYLRGVPHLNVATSLLAQVDASVGGKTGVNTPAGKNLIGAIHQPHGVILHIGALESLPLSEIRNGLAEAVKHGVVADATLFTDLASWAEGGPRALPEELLARCVRVKGDVVARDEEEAGLRRVLNFGHTVAHALEAATDHEMPHGAAVAAGMAVEARIAEEATGFPPEATAGLIQVLDRLGLPTGTDVPLARALPFMGRDKKSREGAIRFALPTDIGAMAEAEGTWAVEVTPEVIGTAWPAST
ncbi:MAG: 3-dehydroquinate synthase [Gemmatimonadetes bacterium]|nr:3-dehydroquinate synthase [Gemmatimonadota bacterium]